MNSAASILQKNERDANSFSAKVLLCLVVSSLFLSLHTLWEGSRVAGLEDYYLFLLCLSFGINAFQLITVIYVLKKKGEGDYFSVLLSFCLYLTGVIFTLFGSIMIWPLFMLHLINSSRYCRPRNTAIASVIDLTTIIALNELFVKNTIYDMMVPLVFFAVTAVVIVSITRYNRVALYDEIAIMEKLTEKEKAKNEALVYGNEWLQKQIERSELQKKTLEEYNRIIADAGLGIWFISIKEGQKPGMNPNEKMKEVLGVNGRNLTEEETYEFWYSRILPSEVASVNASVAEMISGKFSENTYRWNHPEQGVIYVRCGGTCEILEDGTKLLSGYHADVTEIVKKEKEQKEALALALINAERANAAKTNFLNNMSHDIRTPMNAIVGFTELAHTHVGQEEMVRDYLDKIQVSSKHLLNLINDILDMSRIESGKVMLEEQELSLPDLLAEIRTIIQPNIAEKDQVFTIDVQDVRHENLIADKLRVNQILINILSNSVKFTPKAGKISLRLIEKKSENPNKAVMEFRIRDNGIGMSQDFIDHIFEAFTRERNSTVSGVQGTGLGMAITKNIVDMMDGSIRVISQEGKGSEFVVCLPMSIDQSKEKAELPEEIRGMRILLADDDTNTCLSVGAMLRDMGMKVDWTQTAKEAILDAKDAYEFGDAYDAFLISYYLEGMNGIETIEQIRKVIGDSKALTILSAYDWSEVELEAGKADLKDYCRKPIFASELIRVLSQKPSVQEKNRAYFFEGTSILLAEDNALNQEIAIEILKAVGCRIDVAENGEIAVGKVRQAPAGTYDLILMDIQMPHMDGYEAAKRIRELSDEKKANIPIFAMTANAFEEDKQHAFEVGMNGHIAKPINSKLLMETINQVLNKG